MPPGGMALERRKLLEEATRRLERNKDVKARRGISDFVRQNGLADDIELGMRMLDSEMLAELMAGREDLEWKLAEVDDKSAFVLKLISKLDPDVEALVRNLKAEDCGPGAKGKGAAAQKGAAGAAAFAGKRSSGQAADTGEKLLAEALGRVDAEKTPLAKRSIERFVKEWEFGEEVQLALMLLKPIHLREFFAGEADVVQKLEGAADPAKLAVKIITMLDPRVPTLHAALQSQDAAAAPAAKKAKASPATGGPRQPAAPPPKATVSIKAPAKLVRPAGAKAQGAPAAAAEPDQLVFQAEMRLRMNKTPEGAALITTFVRTHGLGEECVLALRMLGKDMLNEFMAGRAAIGKKLAQVADKNEVVLTLVSGLDAEAVDLVKALKKAESNGAHAGGAKGGAAKGKVPHQPLAAPPAAAWHVEMDPYAGHPMV